MAEPPGHQTTTGPLARARGTASSLWLWLRCALYSRDLFGTAGRVLKMIVTLRFGRLAEKVRRLRSALGRLASFYAAAGRPADAAAWRQRLEAFDASQGAVLTPANPRGT